MSNESTSGSQRGGSGNFANDPDKAREAGNKGGEQSNDQSQRYDQSHKGTQKGSQERESDPESGQSQRGGSGNFANDPDKAREAGKKGGEQSHGGQR